MRVCEFCGAELPDNARFCGKCGKTSQSSSGLHAAVTGEPQGVQAEAYRQRIPSKNTRAKWLASISPRWLILGLVLIIIVASGLGIAVAAIRDHLNGPSTTLACSNSANGSCPQQTATAHRGRGVNLRLSGAVNGRLTAVKITRCGLAGLPYDVLAQGKVGGTSYSLVFRITAYSGAGTYGVGQIFANFSRQPVSLTTTWATTGTQPTTATVSSTTRAGTMNITLNGASSTIHITGSWSCG